jgi:pyruvate kinase
MQFKTAFVVHVPDADPEKHSAVLETAVYKLFVKFVKDQQQAVEVCKKLSKEEGIHSIILCPGFTHRAIAEISEAVGHEVGISVARGDGPSGKIVANAMKEAGWF